MLFFRFNCLFFGLLAVATLLAHFLIERFQPVGPELLTDQWQTKVSGKSRIDIQQDHIRIFSDDPQKKVSAFQFLQQIPHEQLVVFFVEMKSDGVIQGVKPWHNGRVSIMQKIDDKKSSFLPLLVTSLTGTNEWKKHQDHFQIPANSTVLFSVELYNAVGSFEARNIQFYPVKEVQAYTWSKNIILSSWAVFFISLIGSCCLTERKNLSLQLVFIVFFVLIVIGTSMQGDTKGFIVDVIHTQVTDEGSIFNLVNESWDVSKIGHFVFFLGLGYALQLITKHKKTWEAFALIAMLACGTELVQIYIDGRTPHFSDVLIDVSGGLLGILLAVLIRKTGNFRPYSRIK